MRLPIGFLFSILYLLILTPVQIYLFTRLRAYVRKRVENVKLRVMFLAFSGCFFALPFMPLVWRAYFGPYGQQRHPGLLQDLLSASSIWWVGSIGCAIVLFAHNFLPRLVPSSRRKPAAASPDPDRRNFLRKGIGVAATAPFMLSGYGVLVERRRFELEHFDIGISGLSSTLSQFTIAQLTDIHLGPFMPPEELARYVEAVNRLNPDVIALTGDFITSSRSEVLPCVETLAGLKARYGIFACLGNHDTFSGAADKLTELLAEKNIQMLRNDSVTVEVGNSKIAILGIDDLVVGHPNLQRARSVAQKQPGEVNILLSHRPEIFPTAAREGMDLVLSGHYHGGQIKLLAAPGGLSIARFLTPYAEGLFQLPRATGIAAGDQKVGSLFVGRGVGITAVPIRINCPPQIAHLTLKNA
jgi:predicted MPP superfamily phosphohydrolase